MSSFARPGIYVQENIVQQTTVNQLRTDAIAAFIGQLPKGPVVPTLISTWSDFVKYFGGVTSSYPTSSAIYTFFSNGGRNAYVQRVVPANAIVARYDYTVTGGTFTVSAINKGAWGKSLSVEILRGSSDGRFSVVVYGPPLVTGGDLRSNVLEQWTDLSPTSTDARYAIDLVNAFSAYVVLSSTGTGAPTVSGTVQPLGYGDDGTALTGATLSQITDTLPNFDNITSPLIFNAPDISTICSGTNYSANRTYGISAWAKLLKYAEYRGDGFVVVDTPNETNTNTTMSAFDAQIYAGDVYGQTASASSSTSAVQLSAITAGTPATGKVQYTTGTTAHGFLVGQTVTIAGVTNTATITGTAANVVRPGYQGATAVAGYVTYTTTSAHGFKTGDSVTIAGVTNTAVGGNTTLYSGTYTVTYVDATNFYVSNTNTATAGLALTSATAVSGGTTGFNGTFTITDVPSTTTFAVANTETVSASTGLNAFSSSTTASVTNSWSAVASSATNGAIYYPWLKIPDSTKSIPGYTLSVAPGGAVIGQYQATDASRGVFKAPAGYNTRIATAVDVTKRLTNAELDGLNTGASNSTGTPVNAIRNVPGAGIVIMGARTLSNSSPNRYINIRRSIINVKKQVERISQFALFENNDEYLWGQIRASVGTFLNQYWMQGGLRGVSPDQAYYVKVDGTTTSDADIANGQVNIQIGIALEYPAEFVVINIGQLTGSSTAI